MSVNKYLECFKTVASTTGIQCTGCNKTIHPRCTKLPRMVYKNLKKLPHKVLCVRTAKTTSVVSAIILSIKMTIVYFVRVQHVECGST